MGLSQGDVEAECASFSFGALHADAPLVFVDDVFGLRQADAVSLAGVGFVARHLVELPEEFPLVARRDAREVSITRLTPSAAARSSAARTSRSPTPSPRAASSTTTSSIQALQPEGTRYHVSASSPTITPSHQAAKRAVAGLSAIARTSRSVGDCNAGESCGSSLSSASASEGVHASISRMESALMVKSDSPDPGKESAGTILRHPSRYRGAFPTKIIFSRQMPLHSAKKAYFCSARGGSAP